MNTVFALYNMLGTFAMSGGILLSGLPSLLQEQYSTLNELNLSKYYSACTVSLALLL